MRLNIKGIEIKFDPEEVRATNRLIHEFLDSVQKASDKEMAPTYWFTLLVNMHLISQQMLDDFDTENIAWIMENLDRRAKNKKEEKHE